LIDDQSNCREENLEKYWDRRVTGGAIDPLGHADTGCGLPH